MEPNPSPLEQKNPVLSPTGESEEPWFCNSMMSKMDCGGSRDLLSDLPEALIGHILSFLSTKEAASTSVLAKKWRYLFALASTLDLDGSVYVNPPAVEIVSGHLKRTSVSSSFMDFVDRVLALQVLERGVSDLDLDMNLYTDCVLPSNIFLTETLVRLKIDSAYGPVLVVEDVHLPKLKTLYLWSIDSKDEGVGLSKLVANCHMLEDLFLHDMSFNLWDFSSVSAPTLKTLRLYWQEREANPKSVSFDTPNLVYLDYNDTIADKYPKVNFGSLVEARIDLRMSSEEIVEAFREYGSFSDDSEGEEEIVLNDKATDFIKGISNVKILYLSAFTLEVLTYCCEAIPLFNNLTHLTIESNPELRWQSLPGLLKNSPNLDTLVLEGLAHTCGVVCVCQPYKCLSSSPVKVLKIMKFGEIDDISLTKQIEQLKHFLETMPNLEQLILYYDTACLKDVSSVAKELELFEVNNHLASSKCSVHFISDK